MVSDTVKCVILIIAFVAYSIFVSWMIVDRRLEEFGSDCVDYVPYQRTPPHPLKKGHIFVSIASYRDDECQLTIHQMFKNAKNPHNIVAGICQQNKEKGEDCTYPPEMEKNIRKISMDHTKAKGPTYARYFCSTLWKGEEFFLQIDSHTYFAKNWDQDCIEMFEQCLQESNRPILTVYPPTDEQMKVDGSPEMCNGKITQEMPVFLAGWTSKSDKPKRCPKPFAAAGFMFLKGDFLYDVPFDPNFSHLFQGEETVFSSRLWTNGYDFFTPNRKVCSHSYGRPDKPKYWDDQKGKDKCRIKAEKRVLFLLKLGPKKDVEDEFLHDFHQYGMGKFRTLEDYWMASGIDYKKKVLEDWCNNVKFKDKKFEGWNFKEYGYGKIKKFT